MNAPPTRPIPTQAGSPVPTLIYNELRAAMDDGYVYTDPVDDPEWPGIVEYPPVVGTDVFPDGWGSEPTERDLAAMAGAGRHYAPTDLRREITVGINIADYAHTAAQRGWGAGWPSCGGASGNLAVVTAARSGVRMSVHKRIARLMTLLLDQTEGPHGYGLKTGQCGAYNCRAIAGTNTASNHSWGLAADLNWQENPYTSGTAHTMPLGVARMFNRYGFAWGGDYTGGKRDYMHLEFMGSQAEADQATALALSDFGGVPMPVQPDQPGGVLAALSNDQLLAMITAMYQYVTGSATVVPQGTPWPGWPTWAGGSNQKLTATDYLRQANVQLTKLQTDIDKIKAALKIQ